MASPLQGVGNSGSIRLPAFAAAGLIFSAFLHNLCRIHFRRDAVNEPQVLVA
jgi:hypothetical protein